MKVREAGLTWSVSSQVGPHVPATVADQALEQLLRSPRLPEAMRRLQAAARAEAKKRRYFYDVVTEQQKAEFINGEIIVHSPVKLPTQSSQLPPGHFAERVCPAPRSRFCRARKTSRDADAQ